MVRRQASVCFSVGFVSMGSTEKEKSLSVCSVPRASGDKGFQGLWSISPRVEGIVKHNIPGYYLQALGKGAQASG